MLQEKEAMANILPAKMKSEKAWLGSVKGTKSPQKWLKENNKFKRSKSVFKQGANQLHSSFLKIEDSEMRISFLEAGKGAKFLMASIPNDAMASLLILQGLFVRLPLP